MDELYNEVCDIIQEQYDCGDLSEEDATTLMEAAYNRYVVEDVDITNTSGIIQELDAYAEKIDSEIETYIKEDEIESAIDSAKTALTYFTTKKIQLNKDLSKIKDMNRAVKVGATVGALGADIGKFKAKKPLKKQKKDAKDDYKEITRQLKSNKDLKGTNELKDMIADAYSDKKKKDKKADMKYKGKLMLGNVVILGVVVTGVVASRLITRLPRKLDSHITHFKRELTNLEKLKRSHQKS